MTINVMVSLNGVNEEGKAITALHTFTAKTEAEVVAWIEKAPAFQRNIDNGPPIRVEIPGRSNKREAS